MFWNKKNRRPELEMRAPKKRRSFFEKKEEELSDPLFSRMIFRLLTFVFIGATFYVLFLSSFLEIKKISLEGIAELKYEDVYRKINESFSGKYFYCIPKNNLILISKNKTKRDLLENFKKISNIDIQKSFPDGIRIKIAERKSLLVWCSGGSCHIIDKNGYAFAVADFESEEVKQNNLLTVRDNSGKVVNIGEKVLDESYIDFVVSLNEKILKETEITIVQEYRTGSRIAEEVKTKTEEGWEIYFSTSLPMKNSIQTLKTFLDKEIDKDKRSKLEYIDLRAENKVYYKFKDEEENMDGEQENGQENQVRPAEQEVKKDSEKKKN